ncbi:glycosyltransferase family 2 protein [Coriobacteriales bacterium OH1046]|nr:glycosyltransferase family 2 protein [Coriobacteriales bacterium OH1046]
MASMRVRTPLISVVVRVRDHAESIQRALESVFAQGLDSFEVVAVDCASRDRSADIVGKLSERDIRIDCLHSDTPSASAAYNLALAHARGTYIAFIDGASWFAPHALGDALDFMQDSHLDLLLFGMSVDSPKVDGSVFSKELSEPTQVFVSQHEFRSNAWHLFEAGQMAVVSGKLFVRERIELLGLRFDETSCGEQGFMARYVRDIERVGVFGAVTVHVPPATMPELGQGDYATLPARCDRHFELMLDLYHHWGLDGDPVSMDVIRNRYLERVVACIGSVCSPACDLPPEEKHRIVVDLIGSEHVRLAASVTKRPRSMVVSAMSIPIKAQNVRLAMGGAAVMTRLFGADAGLPLSLDRRA